MLLGHTHHFEMDFCNPYIHEFVVDTSMFKFGGVHYLEKGEMRPNLIKNKLGGKSQKMILCACKPS